MNMACFYIPSRMKHALHALKILRLRAHCTVQSASTTSAVRIANGSKGPTAHPLFCQAQ